jgi:hypothetical protein
MDKDFKDLLSAFNAHNVRYLIVGGYAYARYTEPRATKDLDLFIKPDPDNAIAAYNALVDFGANLADVTVDDFSRPSTIFQIGVAPLRVDVLCNIDGVTFDQAWETSESALVDDHVLVRYISSDSLIANKLAAGRPQDLIDVEKLRQAARAREQLQAKPTSSS